MSLGSKHQLPIITWACGGGELARPDDSDDHAAFPLDALMEEGSFVIMPQA